MQNQNMPPAEKESKDVLEEDVKHTSEFGEIEAFKHTKYWFKRDIQTIKKAFVATFKLSPVVFFVTFIVSLIMTLIGNTSLDFNNAILYTVILFPIFLLGCFMFYVMAAKGYDIEPYAGTHIKTPEHEKRFSVGYILSSNMSTGRKVLYLLRLAIYILLVVGLFLYLFMSFKK